MSKPVHDDDDGDDDDEGDDGDGELGVKRQVKSS
jgi:hypothetical protein